MHPPRQMHVDDCHPLAPHVEVRVNGMRQQYVLSYDCDAGTVERLEMTPDDEPVSAGDGWSVERVSGAVTVTVR